MANRNIIEEAYVLKRLDDNKNVTHVKGSNEYVFNYNYQWRNIYNQNQKIAIRSVKLWKAARDITILNIPLETESTENPTRVTKAIAGYITKNSFEDFPKLSTPEIEVSYDIINKELLFTTVGEWYFDKVKMDMGERKPEESPDFRAITGKKFIEGQPEYLNGKVKRMIFSNVWDREEVHVRASFGDLTSDGFLGVTNEQFIPPKEYPVNNNDQKFKLSIYDGNDNPIELTSDGKDTLIVEAMMISYN